VRASQKCIVCGAPPGKYSRSLDGTYSIIKCSDCGLEYTLPIPTEKILKEFYGKYGDIRAERAITELNSKELLKRLARYGWTKHSKTLDFGTGDGVFCEMAGDSTYGVDFKQSSNPRIKASLGDALFTGIEWEFITLIGVLEHLQNPLEVMAEISRKLRKGGIVMLTTVNAEGLIPYYYKPPEHLTYWTKQAMQILGDKCGMEIVEYEPYSMTQFGRIYHDRLLSRTPMQYRALISNNLPDIVTIPTNEVLVLMKSKSELK
jgi:2-polyprenyl-3-methyl-5-hydroxy-6-metoxy-1,4-benzoquinol methylase